jgi:hypothetical protein
MKTQPKFTAEEQLTISKIPPQVELVDKNFNGLMRVFNAYANNKRKRIARYIRVIDANADTDLPNVFRVDNYSRSSVLYMTAEECSAYARALGVKVKLVVELQRRLQQKQADELQKDEIYLLRKQAAKYGYKLVASHAPSTKASHP